MSSGHSTARLRLHGGDGAAPAPAPALQRRTWISPLGLTIWNGTSPDHMIKAIRNAADGLDRPEIRLISVHIEQAARILRVCDDWYAPARRFADIQVKIAARGKGAPSTQLLAQWLDEFQPWSASALAKAMTGSFGRMH